MSRFFIIWDTHTVRFDIIHSLSYEYTDAVYLEPHVLRMRPRVDGFQELESFKVSIDPKPIGTTVNLDTEGNCTELTWFEDMHVSFSVTAKSRVTTKRDNPFDYLLQIPKLAVPMTYDDQLVKSLAPAMDREYDNEMVDKLVKEVLGSKPVHIVHFIDLLNQKIYDACEVIHRRTGKPWPPAKTLLEQKGACRDLAVLFIDACRTVGLAARFVSGYRKRPDEPDHELHAWAEVFLPGAGWRGYDPTEALAVADHHIAVAASVDPVNTTPVQGVFCGKATSTFESEITITEVV